jgi:hypothetical protein
MPTQRLHTLPGTSTVLAPSLPFRAVRTNYRCELHADAEMTHNFVTDDHGHSLELCKHSFDLNAYETAEDVKDDDGMGSRFTASSGAKSNFFLDCIEKYCQTEQLEETEMQYCNRCKKHVRTWKQFHLSLLST